MAGCFDSDLGNEFAGLAITDCAWFLGFGPGFDLITLPVDVINGTGAGLAGAGAAALDLRRFRTTGRTFTETGLRWVKSD